MSLRAKYGLVAIALVFEGAGIGVSCVGMAGSAGAGQRIEGKPVETRPANGRDQTPAFAGQTRAPFVTKNVPFAVRRIATLEHPWGLAFLPDGAMLVTEKGGHMRIVSVNGSVSDPLGGVPKVVTAGQGGLLDVTLAPSFATDKTGRGADSTPTLSPSESIVYFAFSEPREGGNGTAVARAKLVREGAPRLEDVRVVWRVTPTLDSSLHFGCRLVFAPDGKLFVTTGERSIVEGRRQAQKLESAFGKIVRITPEGAAPEDNPFVKRSDVPRALPEIWSLGHRNVQAAALHPVTGALWIVDHGARGGDEVNVVKAGRDYGWPTITYGVEYSGGRIGEGITQREGMEQPRYYWDPSIAPSGMAFYEGTMFPQWKGSLFVGALAGKHLARLTLDGENVVGEERLLVDRARIRDVRVAPNGAVMVLTDEPNGELLSIASP